MAYFELRQGEPFAYKYGEEIQILIPSYDYSFEKDELPYNIFDVRYFGAINTRTGRTRQYNEQLETRSPSVIEMCSMCTPCPLPNNWFDIIFPEREGDWAFQQILRELGDPRLKVKPRKAMFRYE